MPITSTRTHQRHLLVENRVAALRGIIKDIDIALREKRLEEPFRTALRKERWALAKEMDRITPLMDRLRDRSR